MLQYSIHKYMNKLQQYTYKKAKTQENNLPEHTSPAKRKAKNNTNTSCQLPFTSAEHNQNKISIISVNLPNQMPRKLNYSTTDQKDGKILNGKQLSESEDDGQQQEQQNRRINKNKEENQGKYKRVENCKENQLYVQNKRLKIINKELKKQLQQFEKKLDATLKKHSLEHSEKKVKYKVGQEILQNMELRNAYKMCEIYKKQISYLKRKEASGKQSKMDQLQNNIFILEKQKQHLLQEIKDVKKINKQQQKGLRELSGPSAMKLLEQNEKLKESIRRLQNLHGWNENEKKKDKEKSIKKEKKELRQQKIKKSNVSDNEQISNQKKSKRKEKQSKSDQPFGSLQKQNRIFKQKGDAQELRDKQIQDNELQMQKLKNRILKDHKKLTNLLSQNNKYRQYIEELKNQLIDKDKQCSKLRQKINQLREQNTQLLNKNNNHGSSSRHKRVQTQPQLTSSKPHKKSLRKVLMTVQPKSLEGQPLLLHERQLEPSESNYFGKYPRVLESGYRIENSFRWNHHHLSSKIKQVQIYPHPLGHIKEINFRYQKGEPNKPSGKFASFCCEQNRKQWVKSIKGGYKNGILRYLIVESNKGRKANFCQFEMQSQCVNFQFKSTNSGEYLGAFFGQNISEGISRLGCFLQIQK